jgi:hypothetical protein
MVIKTDDGWRGADDKYDDSLAAARESIAEKLRAGSFEGSKSP